MAQLSHSELNSIREVVACHQTASNKLREYSEQCNDARLKQMLSKASDDAKKSAQTLLGMI